MSGCDRQTEAETWYIGRCFTTTASLTHDDKKAAQICWVTSVACTSARGISLQFPASSLTVSSLFGDSLLVMNILPMSYNVVLFNRDISWEPLQTQLAYGWLAQTHLSPSGLWTTIIKTMALALQPTPSVFSPKFYSVWFMQQFTTSNFTFRERLACLPT